MIYSKDMLIYELMTSPRRFLGFISQSVLSSPDQSSITNVKKNKISTLSGRLLRNDYVMVQLIMPFPKEISLATDKMIKLYRQTHDNDAILFGFEFSLSNTLLK